MTLIARPIRHFRAVVYSSLAVVAILMVPALAMPGPLEVRSAVYGVVSATILVGVIKLLQSSGGDPHSMSLPLANVSLAKRRKRVLVLNAAFDPQMRVGQWTLVAASGDDAEAIADALTPGDPAARG